MTLPNDDLDRLRIEYARRAEHLSTSDIYSTFNPSYLFGIQARMRDTIKILRQHGLGSLDELRVFELGCGSGGVLLEFLSYGVKAQKLHGCDLLPDRLKNAWERVCHLPICCADGQSLPYPPDSFDLVLQYTVFSSILDDEIKKNLAKEILRVLQPNGMILWYDFWLNPTNPHTRGIQPVEIKNLFPDCTFTFRKVTLAPPIARRVVPVSWILALALEKLRVFNSHFLVAIKPD